MGKGELTRQAILERAFARASRFGLEGLTIGALAEEAGLSKSGLFAHFQSKEGLQLAVVEHAAERFVEAVITPALVAPRGEPRLRAFFDRWLAWEGEDGRACFFAAASFEVDDRPGPLRERIAQLRRDYYEFIANIARTAVAERHFRPELDPEQVAFEIVGVTLVTQECARLLRDEATPGRARRAFEGILARARAAPV